MTNNEFNGVLLGSIEEIYGNDVLIKIDERFLNNTNITLRINNSIELLCSKKLSDEIRNNIHKNVDILKKYSVYNFDNERTFVILNTNNYKFEEKQARLRKAGEEYMAFFEKYLEIIRDNSISKVEREKWDLEDKRLKLKKEIEIENINQDYDF